MIGKYAQRRIYDAINRPPVYCFIGVSIATFILGFITNMVIYRWYSLSVISSSPPITGNNPWWTEAYIGKTRNIDISKYISQEPIDVVYTWVNGSDPQFLQDLETYLLLSSSRVDEYEKDAKNNECKLENCISYAAIVFDKALSPGFIDCLKSKDDGIVVDEENDDGVVFVAFPKSKNETQCGSGSRVEATSKPGCITSSAIHTPSVPHPFAFYLTGASRLGTFKDAKSLRNQLPTTVADRITDLKVDVDSDFAVLFFQNEIIKEDAEKELQVNWEVRINSPSIMPAFIVDCEEYLAANALKLEAKPKRFVDNEELRFSLRSLDQFAPWVRHVYLVTNGQIPSWLNLDNPHITLITHRDIFGEKSDNVLPTFSSPAIESQLINIPGIGEKFIYFNDDFFLGQNIYPEDFITHSTGRKFYLTYSLPNCAPGCPHTWIKDGYCDRACNTSDCDFDGGDCQIGANSTTLPIPVDPLDFQFALERAYCSNGCSNAWIADNFCDSYCNVPACAFDGGDCGLSALLNPHYGFVLFKIEPTASKTVVINVPKQQSIAIANLSAVVPHGKQFKIGKCSTPVTPALRTSSFVASHSLFILIAYRNISSSNFTAECELTFADSITVQFAISFDTSLPPLVDETLTTTPPVSLFLNSSSNFPPKLIKITSIRSFFDRFPANRRQFAISICSRFVPLVRRYLFQYKKGDLTKLGLGVFLESLSSKNVACLKNFVRNVEFNIKEHVVKFTEPPISTSTSPISSSVTPRFRRKIPGLNRQQQATSLMLSRFRPRSLNYANPNSSALNQEQMAPDAFSGSLLHVNRLMNRDFGYAQRRMPGHVPLLIERRIFKELYQRYLEDWLATSSRRFRSHQDMQLQFSYTYFVMSTTLADSSGRDSAIEQLFKEEIDLDESGDLSAGELRNLIIRADGATYSLQSWRRFGNSMVQHGCFQNLTEFLSVFASSSDDSSNQPPVRSLRVDDVKNCQPLRDLFLSVAKLLAKYKFEALITDDDSAVFRMLGAGNSALLVESWLNSLRRRPPKFFCLNDDLDHSEPMKTDTERILTSVRQFLSETYPRRSQFELPPNYRNLFRSVDEYRRYRAEKLRYKTVTFYGFILVTAAIILLCIYRWSHFLLNYWPNNKKKSSSSAFCGLSVD